MSTIAIAVCLLLCSSCSYRVASGPLCGTGTARITAWDFLQKTELSIRCPDYSGLGFNSANDVEAMAQLLGMAMKMGMMAAREQQHER